MTLLFDAFSAYLGPLLAKHAEGKYLVWEDLEASHAAAKAFLKSHDNVFVTKKVENLHRSQVKAYQEAAGKAIKEWAQSAALEPMEENDTEDMFVARCVSAVTDTAPNWKVDVSRILGAEISKLAKTAFAKYNPSAPVNDDPEEGEEEEDGEEGEEIEEDGEIGDDEMVDAGATVNTPASKAPPKTGPKKGLATKNKKVTKANKATVRKKATSAKLGNGKVQATRGKGAARGRRVGGRGGAAASKN